MKIVEINSNGRVHILFSEAMVSIIELTARGLNMTYLNEHKHEILKIEYKTEIGNYQLTKPNLTDWNIIEFKKYELIL